MFNYLIKIEYVGTNFVGWQSQKNGQSIQDSIEKVLKKVLGRKIKIIGAGRTDKGVHAYGQCANFFYDKEIKDKKIISKGIPGTILDDNLTIACSKNAIRIVELKKESKQKMTADEFLKGNKIKTGQSLN